MYYSIFVIGITSNYSTGTGNTGNTGNTKGITNVLPLWARDHDAPLTLVSSQRWVDVPPTRSYLSNVLERRSVRRASARGLVDAARDHLPLHLHRDSLPQPHPRHTAHPLAHPLTRPHRLCAQSGRMRPIEPASDRCRVYWRAEH